MNDLFVYGSFKTVLAAETAANQLVDAGVPRQAIALGAERDLSSETTTNFSLFDGRDLKTADTQDDVSLWDRIVGIFQTEDDHETNEAAIDFEGYRSAIALGDILLLVEEEYRHVIEQTVNPDMIINSPGDSENHPTEADRRMAQGGSFASEDLSFHAPDELEIPETELTANDPLVDDTVNPDMIINSPEASENHSTEADRRMAQGGSFASEDLSVHAADELEIPETELTVNDPLVDDTVNLDRDFEKDPHR